MEKQGRIIALMPERSGVSARGKEWASQNFVLQEYDQQYPRHICFSVFGRVDELEIREPRPYQYAVFSGTEQLTNVYFD